MRLGSAARVLLAIAATEAVPMRILCPDWSPADVDCRRKPTEWKLVIHGGAGVIERARITPEKDREIRAALDLALQRGSAVLVVGRKRARCGRGGGAGARGRSQFQRRQAARSSPTTARIELDASIMDGRNRAAGAVTGVGTTRNPISLARAVMEKSPHVFLSGPGADRFAREQEHRAGRPELFRDRIPPPPARGVQEHEGQRARDRI